MQISINNNLYEVVVIRKSNKNTYIRVKDDLKIYVTTSHFSTKSQIIDLIKRNLDSIKKMIESKEHELEKEKSFFYLGNGYDIIEVSNQDKIEIIGNTIYTKNKKELDKWYKDEIIRVFDERFVNIYNQFEEVNKSPILKIRTMKTRWGVYNRKNHSITLNSRLIEFEPYIIDYVIIHELSHVIHFNHSNDFWKLVSKYCPDYKKIRKIMKE